jgi:hypothetical protein
MEEKTTIAIFQKDCDIIIDFQNRKGLKTRCDALRIAIEYANAHGALK